MATGTVKWFNDFKGFGFISQENGKVHHTSKCEVNYSRFASSHVILLIAFLIGFLCFKAQAQVVCNQFDLMTNLRGNVLDITLQTDLPDFTVLMVSVSRSYLEKGNSATYSCDYFSEKSTVKIWKSKHNISLSEAKWRASLKAKQQQLSRLGLGFQVASISDKINIRLVVPINQSDPKFGKENSRLSGVKVASKGLRVVEAEKTIHYPLGTSVAVPATHSLDPNALDIGQTYIVSKDTPLMPELNPTDASGAIQRIKQIPKGGMIKIHEVRKKGGTPWYRVSAIHPNKTNFGDGWINSTALIGQELKTLK